MLITYRGRNTPIRRRVQSNVLREALKQFLSEDCPNKVRLLELLAKLPSEGEDGQLGLYRILNCIAIVHISHGMESS